MPTYKNASDFPHPGMKTLEETRELTGLAISTLKKYIYSGKIGAVLRRWRYGVYRRQAWFIPISELKRFAAKRAVSKHLRSGEAFEWHPAREDDDNEPFTSI